MKITFNQTLLFMLLTSISLANPLKAQDILDRKINISVENKSLEDVIKKLAKTQKIQFVYDHQILQNNDTFTIDANGESLKSVLEKLHLKYKFNYQLYKDKIILTESRINVGIENKQFKEITITGKVTDESNAPLPGLSVSIKGSTGGTLTDLNGLYSLKVPDNTVSLVFSFLGYTTQEINVAGKTVINVNMVPDQKTLNEVVVVGYGTQKKSDVTGAVASADIESFRDAPNTNIVQSLQGTVPGLNIGQVTTTGATPSISIRGNNTLSGNKDVLVILDGIQYNGSLSSLNPDDIEAIDVLKDASSTAVYGAQAANGVIIITTKKGSKDKKTRFSFSSSYATQTPTSNIRPLNREEYINHVRDLYYDEAFLAPDYTQPNPAFDVTTRVDAAMRDAQNNISPNNFDWYDEATKTGNIFDNQLSITGGSDNFNYLLSGNITDQKGFIINDIFKRKGIRANLESKPASWLKLGLQSFASFVNRDGDEPGFRGILQQSPLVLPYDDDGNIVPYPFKTNYSSPFLTYDTDDYERHNYFFANLYTDIQIPFIKGLSYRLNFGNNYRVNKHYSASIYGAGLTGSAYKENEDYADLTLDNILTYNRGFGKHDFGATLLYGSMKRENSYTNARATNFSRLTLGYNSLEQGTNQFTSSDAWQETLQYQMARLNYKYDNRYLLTATIRQDGFSGFAENNKKAVFPSVALGWILSNESYFKVSWVDNLKLRLGYGVSGNQTQRYYSLSTVSAGPSYVFGDGGSTIFGQEIQSLANSDLKWEKTKGINLGLDFSLFKGVLFGNFDYYNNNTNDLLYNVKLPSITGFDEIRTNIGELNNQGLELTLNSRNINSGNFKWNTTFNISRNRDKILSLVGLDADGDGAEDDLISSGLFINQPIYTIFNFRSNGIYQIGETVPNGYSAGTYRVQDLNNDGVINADDREIIGYGTPTFRASLLNKFDYKNFSLTVFLNTIQGLGNDYLGANSPSITRNDNTVRYNSLTGIDYWSPINPNGKYTQSIVESAVSPTQYQNRSFIRLQDISLAYKLPSKLINKFKIQNLSVYVSGKNLATWTNWEGWDPETNQGLTIDGRPVLKGISTGINLTF